MTDHALLQYVEYGESIMVDITFVSKNECVDFKYMNNQVRQVR